MLTLKTKNLNVRYMDHIILKDINILLEEGKSYAIIGQSGEGKSTLLKALDGLLDNNSIVSGEISLNNLPISDYTQTRRTKITYLLQDPANQFNPVYTIGHQLDMSQRYSNNLSKEERRARTLSMLKEMNLGHEVYHLYPNQLSGGMLQRANIAIALLQDKDILMLDEPTQGLDVELEDELIEKLINRNDRKNKITIFITHSLKIACKANHIFCMDSGTIVEDGPTETIMKNPKTDFMRTMLEASVYA